MTQLILLDTDVFSFLFKRDSRAALYAPHLANAQTCLSFQTVAELRYWARIRRWGDSRRKSLEQAMRKCLILSCDDATSARWADVMAVRRQAGQPIDCGDAWVAATALRHAATLITHNGKHYAGVPDLQLISHGSATP